MILQWSVILPHVLDHWTENLREELGLGYCGLRAAGGSIRSGDILLRMIKRQKRVFLPTMHGGEVSRLSLAV